MTVPSCWWRVQALCGCRGERRVICIDIRDLNFDEALRVYRRRAPSARAAAPRPSRRAARAATGNVAVPNSPAAAAASEKVDEGGRQYRARAVVADLTSSSYTCSTHHRLGASRSLICGLTRRSNATSGTSKLGRGPIELRMTVQMSWLSRLCVGSMLASACPKAWLNI